MAEKIKKFFKKKKLDAKFKIAGPGHKLTEATSSNQDSKTSDYKPIPRSELSSEAKAAAEAALARLGNKKKDTAFNTSFAAIQAQVKRELEDERKKKASELESSQIKEPKITELEYSPVLAVHGVYFRCPIISDEVLSKNEWNDKIKQFLYEQLEEEKGLTSCLMIHSLNKNRDKVAACIETLCKYLENIILNPNEEKYKRIRMTNRIFSEKVQPIVGSLEFLQAAGFEQETIDNDQFLAFHGDVNEEGLENLQSLCDALRTADPIPLELDRNLQVLSPAQASKRTELPDIFYALTPEELKKEQQLRTEAAEASLQLRTKAMRERDELRKMRKYRFAVVRVRFPNGIFLQGTFGVYEKFVHVIEFIRENIEFDSMPFILQDPTGIKLTEENVGDKTLIELRLVPASILTFSWDPDVSEALTMNNESTYLKPDLLMLLKSV